MHRCIVCGCEIFSDDDFCFSCGDDKEFLKNKQKREEEMVQRFLNSEQEIEKLKDLVRSAYSEGFGDGMGNKCESDCWQDSQTFMCLKDGFDIYKDKELPCGCSYEYLVNLDGQESCSHCKVEF